MARLLCAVLVLMAVACAGVSGQEAPVAEDATLAAVAAPPPNEGTPSVDAQLDATTAAVAVTPADAAAAAAVAPAAVTTYNVPLNFTRSDWPDAGGYCGEFSIQAIAMRHGVWVSQNQARLLGGGELLLGVNLEGVVNRLGLSSWPWNSVVAVSAANLQKFMLFMKGHLAAGRPTIFAARIAGGTDSEYDHIMPMFGVSTSVASTVYSTADVWTWTNDFGAKITRAGSATSFFAGRGKCTYSDAAGGCISSDSRVYGLAVGGMKDSVGLMKPLRLTITRWSNGAPATTEPKPAAKASANYTLSTEGSGLVAGQGFLAFRCNGAGAIPANPTSLTQLRALRGCVVKGPFTMAAGLQLDDRTFGPLASDSVAYFFGVVSGSAKRLVRQRGSG